MVLNSNLDSFTQQELTPEQRIADAVAPLTAQTQVGLTFELRTLADLLGIATHPLVGEKFPGETNPWPDRTSDLSKSDQAQVWLPVGYDPFGAACPVVVAVNQVGGSYLTPPQAVIDGCNARGAILVSLKILTLSTWAGPIASLSISAILRHLAANYNIDRTRIYGIGASRGGGVIARHAAANRSPYDLPFAAVQLTSPDLERRQWWSKLPPTTTTGQAGADDNNFQHRAHSERPDNMGGRWGRGRKAEHRFAISNALFFTVGSYGEYPDFSAGGTADATRSLGVTLYNIPVRINYDTGDSLITFPNEADQLYTLLNGLGGTVVRTISTGADAPGNHAWPIIGGSGQDTWETILTWLFGFRLTSVPATMKVVAGDDTLFGAVKIERTDRDDTGRFFVTVDTTPASESIDFTSVLRCKVLDVDVQQTALKNFTVGGGTPLVVTSDAGTVLRLRNLKNVPSAVAGTGMLAGGLNVGYIIGGSLYGANSVEIYPSGAGAMSLSIT